MPLTPRPSPLILPYEPDADLTALKDLARWCEQFSPAVGIESTFAPDSLLLDITGLEHLFGGQRQLAEKVAAAFAARGLIVRVAVADTVGAAWAVAHYAREENEDKNLHSPFVIHHSAFIIHHSSSLLPLPLAALRLPAETLDLFEQLGLERIEQVVALPREDLSARFGQIVLVRLDQAFGRLAEPIIAHQPPPVLQSETAIEFPTTSREVIESFFERLLRPLARQLDEQGLGALCVECRFDCRAAAGADAEAFRLQATRFSVGLFEPSAAPDHLRQLLAMQLERLKLPGPVVGITLAIAATAPIHHRQTSLFDEPRRPSRRQLAALVERLSGRLGPQAVVGARLAHEALPELAWREASMVGAPARRRHAPPPSLPPRPLMLLPRPEPLAVTSVAPHGPPVQFQLRGNRHRVVESWGPERIETGWWRGRMVGRDYYRVETAAGSRFWLFRQPYDGRWFLHGRFE